MTQTSLAPALCVAATLTLWPLAVTAQNVLVTTGEHGTFTRLVLQSSEPIGWSLEDGSDERRLTLEGEQVRLDLSRAFTRINRSRLAGLEQRDGALVLALGCNCEIQAWEERPGLVVLDIRDSDTPRAMPRPDGATVTDLALPAAESTFGRRNDRSSDRPADPMARSVGTSLARDLMQVLADEPSPTVSAQEQAEIARALAAQVAGALGQGLLTPSAPLAQASDMVLPGEGQSSTDVPPNLRITSVLDRPTLESTRLPDPRQASCQHAPVIEELMATAPEPFVEGYARLMRGWMGEFDIAQHEITQGLAQFYLLHGFGAEARSMIENATAPIAGRDLLLGFSDILEGRHSNSRLRLAEAMPCGGSTAMLAALAGAPSAQIELRATDIAIAFTQTPASLRALLGPDLVRHLLAADARDAARIVTDALRHTTDVTLPDMTLLDAQLERARGEIDRAAALLEQGAPDDAEVLLAQLDVALARTTTVPRQVLENAEAVASGLRATETGIQLMDRIIRLQVLAGAPLSALELGDRLAQWRSATPSHQEQLDGLSDVIWRGMADTASDAAFLATIMARADWNRPALSPATRAGLAARMLDFGLLDQAAALVEPAETTALREQLARLHLLRGTPEAALTALEGLNDPATIALRARALQSTGDSGEAQRLLAETGALDEAVRVAVAAQDWQALADLGERRGEASQQDLARALASVPGQFGMRPEAASQTDADSTDARPTPPPPGSALLPVLASSAPATLDTADPDAPGALQRGADLLAESESLRQTLEALVGTARP